MLDEEEEGSQPAEEGEEEGEGGEEGDNGVIVEEEEYQVSK